MTVLCYTFKIKGKNIECCNEMSQTDQTGKDKTSDPLVTPPFQHQINV